MVTGRAGGEKKKPTTHDICNLELNQNRFIIMKKKKDRKQ